MISRCDYFVVACDYFSNRDWLRVSLSIKAGKRNIEYSNGRGHKFASASNWKGNRRTEFSDALLFFFWGQRGWEGGAPHRSVIEIRDVYGREYREKGRRRATCLPDCSTGYVKLLGNVGIPWINDEWRARSGNEILRKKRSARANFKYWIAPRTLILVFAKLFRILLSGVKVLLLFLSMCENTKYNKIKNWSDHTFNFKTL